MKALTLARYTFGVCGGIAVLIGCSANIDSVSKLPANAPGSVLPYGKTFRYTGGEQSFKVPAGVYSITVVARGAAGGGDISMCPRGNRGGRVSAIIPVTPGETLDVFVGGQGSGTQGGFNGGGSAVGSGLDGAGGAGGASDIRVTPGSLSDRILVAGGGGGQGGSNPENPRLGRWGCGGGGGLTTGGSGGHGYDPYKGGGGGSGGTQSQGGAGGAGGHGSIGYGYPGGPGSLGTGGTGGMGGDGNGGGGGAGYYGGGGGGGGGGTVDYFGDGGGGGGGSSYVEQGASFVHMWQGWYKATTNGLVVFSWR